MFGQCRLDLSTSSPSSKQLRAASMVSAAAKHIRGVVYLEEH